MVDAIDAWVDVIFFAVAEASPGAAAVGLKLQRRGGRRRRGYAISDELLRGFNVLGLAEGIISLILHGPRKWRALARKRKKK